jgi:hypothetical protein
MMVRMANTRLAEIKLCVGRPEKVTKYVVVHDLQKRHSKLDRFRSRETQQLCNQ